MLLRKGESPKILPRERNPSPFVFLKTKPRIGPRHLPICQAYHELDARHFWQHLRTSSPRKLIPEVRGKKCKTTLNKHFVLLIGPFSID